MALSLLIPPAATQLYQPSNTRVLQRHQLLPTCHDSLWRIECGCVRTSTITEDGALIVLGYWGAGDVIGHAISQVTPYQIECLTEVKVSLLSQEHESQSTDALLKHIQQVQELLIIIHHSPIERRLWQFLTFLAQKFGVEVEQGVAINLNLTHQELAEAINVTRVMVTRLLQQFEHEGLLLRQKKQLILLY